MAFSVGQASRPTPTIIELEQVRAIAQHFDLPPVGMNQPPHTLPYCLFDCWLRRPRISEA